MGNQNETKAKKDELTLNVANLNYSGILKSPYEFYEKGEDGVVKAEIGKQFFELVQKQLQQKNDFKWKFGNLDKVWQETRYSPLYMASCGINNIFMMDRIGFEAQWNHRKKQQQLKIKQIKNESVEHIKNMRTFDVLIYQAILLYVYRDSPKQREKIEQNFSAKDSNKSFRVEAKKYRDFQKKMFGKKFLNQQFKIALVKQFIVKKEIDIFFIQEATSQLVKDFEQKLPQFRIVKDIQPGNPKKLRSQSLIIIRDSKFSIKSLREQNMIFYNNIRKLDEDNEHQQWLTDQQIKKMNLNNDTTIQAIGNLFLISCHLKSQSKKSATDNKKNLNQLQELHKLLVKLRTWFKDCEFIVGGDLNGKFMDVSGVKNLSNGKDAADQLNWGNSSQYYVFPEDETKIYTTNKIRTLLQVQEKKAHEKSIGIKDYLISTLKLENTTVMNIKRDIIHQKDQSGHMNSKKDYEENKREKKGRELEEQYKVNFTDQLIGFMNLDSSNLKAKARQICSDEVVPNNDHPFDHFIVFATVRLKKPILRIDSCEYKKMFMPQDLTSQDIEQIDKNEH